MRLHFPYSFFNFFLFFTVFCSFFRFFLCFSSSDFSCLHERDSLQRFAPVSGSGKWWHRMHIRSSTITVTRCIPTFNFSAGHMCACICERVSDSQSFLLCDDVIAEITGKFPAKEGRYHDSQIASLDFLNLYSSAVKWN